MEHPFAISLDVGTSLANQTGSWRTSRPVYVDRLPPCNNACPAGENIQDWLYHAESGDYETAWRTLDAGQSAAGGDGPGLLSPLRNRLQSRADRPAVGINSVERFLGDEAIEQGLEICTPRRETGKRVLVVGAGPSGLSAAYHLRALGPCGQDPRGRPYAGRHDAFRHSEVSPAARHARRRNRSASSISASSWSSMPKSTASSTRMQAGRFDAAFLAVGAHIAKRAYIPAGEAAKILDAVTVLRSMEGEDKPLLGRRVVVYGGGNTALDAARTAKRLGATEAIIVYRRTRDRMPAHDFEVEEALEEGIMIKWLSTIKRMDEGMLTVEKMAARRQGLSAADRRIRDAGSRLAGAGARPGRGFGAARRRARPWTSRTAWCRSRQHDDRLRRDLRRRRHGSVRTHRDGRGRPRQEGRAPHRRVAERRVYQPAEKHELAGFDKLNAWYYADAPKTVRPCWNLRAGKATFDEVRRRP